MANINYGSIATEIGLIKLSNASLLNKPINITQIKLGDSNGIEYTPDGSETDLKNVVYTGLPNSITPDPDNPDQFAAIELVVPSDTESFYVREMGAYDDEGDLIYIAAIAPRFKPQASAQSVDMSFELMVKILNADNVTIKVDTSKAIATQAFVNQEIDNHKTDPNAHSQYLKAEDLKSATEDDAGIAKIATKSIAETGTNDTDFMTSLKTKQSIDKNVPDASETEKGKVQKATDSEVATGNENTKFITSKQLKDFREGEYTTDRVTGARSPGSNYTNTYGHLIYVSIIAHSTTGNGASIHVGGNLFAEHEAYHSNKRFTIAAEVPLGSSYRVELESGTVIDEWIEVK